MKSLFQKLFGKSTATAPQNAKSAPVSSPSPTKPTLRKISAPAPPAPLPKRNPAKDKLYGDLPVDQWPPPGVSETESPWADFVAARNHLHAGRKGLAIAHWRAVLDTPALETLHYLQAWFFLRQNEVRPTPEEASRVFGVIGENGPSGVLIAVYEDGQARLYSDSGQAIVWAHPDNSLDAMIEAVLLASWKIVEAVHPWKTAHIALPKSNINSISVLTPCGFYIKTGAPQAFESDPLVQPITTNLGQIIRSLMEKTGQAK